MHLPRGEPTGVVVGVVGVVAVIEFRVWHRVVLRKLLNTSVENQ